jgi:hypothetical protein
VRGGDIVKESCVVECLQPVGFRQVGVGEHGPYFVQEGLVQAFGHTIMLWYIGSGYFVLDPRLLKILLNVAGHVLTPSI